MVHTFLLHQHLILIPVDAIVIFGIQRKGVLGGTSIVKMFTQAASHERPRQKNDRKRANVHQGCLPDGDFLNDVQLVVPVAEDERRTGANTDLSCHASHKNIVIHSETSAAPHVSREDHSKAAITRIVI